MDEIWFTNILDWLCRLSPHELIYYTIWLLILVFAFLVHYRYRRTELTRLKKDILCLTIIGLAVCTSYHALHCPVTPIATDKWTISLSPAIAFPVLVFLKVLIGFWAFHMLYCLLNSDRIAESGFKIFGVETNNRQG